MANYQLFIDKAANRLVASSTSNTPADPPPFVQEDTLFLDIYVLERTSGFPTTAPIFSIVPNAAFDIQAAIGVLVGNTSLLYTQQFTWSKSIDGNYWSAEFPMNTAGITTLLASNASATSYFEIKLFSAGKPTTVLRQQITVWAAVIKTGSLVEPALPTPLSAEAAAASFLGRTIVGQIRIENETTGKGFYLYADEDGNPQMPTDTP